MLSDNTATLEVLDKVFDQVQRLQILKLDQTLLLLLLAGRRDFNIDADRLAIKEQIGFGAFASVLKGCYKGHQVAVKVAKIYEDQCQNMSEGCKKILERDIFLQEVSIWCKLDHPNVTKFIGATIGESVTRGNQKDRLRLVTEFLSGGTLQSFIMKNRRRELPLPTVLRMALDLARGLSYLHSKKIVHRDIKPDNLLFDSHGRLKIADFGVSCVEASDPSQMTEKVGTLAFMAPEVLKSEPYNRKCDVYSFGICLWEIYCCDFPYDPSCISFWEMTSMVVNLKVRPPIPNRCPKELALLMQTCWDPNPNMRPEMQQVVTVLEDLQTSRGRDWWGLFACLHLHGP